ncbi:MAG: TRAP transporter large permease subunit [Candidatus Margulisbacteria bacterium]|nr:TRAP transporter large permease subunit [Candidatus Margulisiibacteriota bacterium]
MTPDILSLGMFAAAFGILLLGYPVAFSLAGTALTFALLGSVFDWFDLQLLGILPERLFGIMSNETLIAIPLFIMMGVLLERSKISEDLLTAMSQLFGTLKGGLGISVCIVGAILAASTGIVGATVVTMGLISLPTMLKNKYSPKLATGIITASGTLGQIIPPSIILVILGDIISSAHQEAQLSLGNFSPGAISVGDLFFGAVIPGLILVACYILYVGFYSHLNPQSAPVMKTDVTKMGHFTLLKSLCPPLLLMIGVLGSIFLGVATPSEAASVGCIGALLLTGLKKKLTVSILKDVTTTTTRINCMVFTILIGASIFSLVFRGFGGDELVHHLLINLPGGSSSAFFIVMAIIFFMGFFLDFFEITFVVVPIVGPILLTMGFDPVWLGIMIALNLQTSFLTPPFGFALFYLRGVAPPQVSTMDIYKGVIPFIIIQITVMALIWFIPEIVTWLPRLMY